MYVVGVQQLSPLLEVQHRTLQTKDSWLEGTRLPRLQLQPGADRRELGVSKEVTSTSFYIQSSNNLCSQLCPKRYSAEGGVQRNPFTPVTHT